MVAMPGLEPGSHKRLILSQLSLPISPHRHFITKRIDSNYVSTRKKSVAYTNSATHPLLRLIITFFPIVNRI